MPRRTNEFQRIVVGIYRAFSGTDVRVEESAMVREKNSDAEREVDVLVTASIAGHETRLAIECRDHTRDQDISWVDSLIGKYANLPVHKIVAVSATGYSSTAFQKAAQHGIELLTITEASEADWPAKVGPTSVRYFGYRNRPLIVGLWLGGKQQLKLEYTFDGVFKTQEALHRPFSELFLDVWDVRMSIDAASKISAFVHDNWEMIRSQPDRIRYCEIVEEFPSVRSVIVDSVASLAYDKIVWGIGTKCVTDEVVPRKLLLGDKAVAIASTLNDQGAAVHLTLALNKLGQPVGASVRTGGL